MAIRLPLRLTPRPGVLVGLALVVLLLPLMSGLVIPTYRDAAVTHFPVRAELQRQLQEGLVPFVNPGASCGQPLAGNPNFATFFPDTALLYVLSARAAFGFHFAIAWLLALLGARRWARAEGADRPTADLAGLAFATSGPMLSAWTFYNAGMALALAPWVLAASARLGGPRDRRRVAEVAIVAALSVLAGEPVISLLTFLVAGSRAALVDRRSLPRLAAGLALAALLAAPQILTAWQATQGSSRHQSPYSFQAVTETSVAPARFLELLGPFPFGRPDLTDERGFQGHELFGGHAPYLWSLHIGPLPLLLLVAHSDRRRFGWWILAVGAGALSLGRALPLAEVLVPVLSLGGRIRYPVKAWYVVILALVPLLALAMSRRDERGRSRAGLIVGVAAAGLAIHSGHWWSALAVAVAAAWVVLRPRRGWPLVLGVTSMAVHAPLLLAIFDSHLPPLPEVGPGRIFERVLATSIHPLASQETPTREVFQRARAEAWSLAAVAEQGGYAFDADPDGTYSFLDRVFREATDQTPWPERPNLLRSAGVDTVIVDRDLGPPFHLLWEAKRGARAYRLEGSMPRVRLATSIESVPSLSGVIARLRKSAPSPAAVLIPGPRAGLESLRPGGRLDVTVDVANRLEVEVDSLDGGVVVWNVSHLRGWRARVDSALVQPLVADGHLVGVRVPPGSHRVVVDWDPRFLMAGLVCFFVSSLLVGVLLWPPRKRDLQS